MGYKLIYFNKIKNDRKGSKLYYNNTWKKNKWRDIIQLNHSQNRVEIVIADKNMLKYKERSLLKVQGHYIR